MIRFAPALALLLAASAAQALEVPPVCKALHGLAEAARTAGPQRVSLGSGSGGCQRMTPGVATAEFCAAVAGSPLDVTPWQVNECVRTLAADPQLAFGQGPSGYREKPVITRLAAKLGGGVRLDISRAADRYDLVVWKKD